MVTQLLALRAFLDLFAGNELTLGVILAVWLCLFALGCYLGRGVSRRGRSLGGLVGAQILVGLLPISTLCVTPLIARLFPIGSVLGLGEVFRASLLALAPFCLVSGLLLTLLAGAISSRRDARQIGDVYVLDSLGGIFGGVLFSSLLVHFVEPLQIASGLLFSNLLAAALLAHAGRRPGLRAGALGVLAVSFGLLFATDLERWAVHLRFAGLDVAQRITTPSGDLVVTRRGGETTVFASGLPLGSTNDFVAAEESVHYALAQHPAPRDVLLVSGAVNGAVHEIGKYPVDTIDVVELDPAVLELAEKICELDDPRVRPIAEDPRRVVRGAKESYDAILMALPDPSSAQLNRFYTREFFGEVQRALRPKGVFGFQLCGAENYAGPELSLVSSSVKRALDEVFPEVLVVPGSRLCLIASAEPLALEAFANLGARGIDTRYVRPEFLSAKLTADRIALAEEIVSADAAPNRDFHPGSYFAHLRWWLSRFGSSLLAPALFVLALLIGVGTLLARAPRRSVPAALFASGFTGLGLEVVILIAFQVSFGNLYRELALVITSFLVGAALGAFAAGRVGGSARRLLLGLDLALALTAVALAGGITALESGAVTSVPPAVFAVANGLVGLFVGGQLPAAAKLAFRGVEKTAGEVFAFDSLGACLGALLVGAFAIPLLGMGGTCLVLGGIKGLSFAGLLLGRPVGAPVPSAADGERPVLAFGVMFLVFVGLGLAIVAEDSAARVYDFSFGAGYQWSAVGLLGLGILLAIGLRLPARGGPLLAGWRKVADGVYDVTKVRLFQWGSFLVLALAAFYPLFRCYFKVPWLFCHVCPRKCVFGFLRPYLIPAALIMNLEKRFWCTRACPVGSLGTVQGRVCPSSTRPWKPLRVISWLVLVFTIVSYFKIESDYTSGGGALGDWYTFFYENLFATSAVVVILAAAVILFTVRWRRPFCEVLCPVGRCSDLIRKLEQRLPRDSGPRRSRRQAKPEEGARA